MANSIIRVFMHGQEMTEADATEQYKQLVEEMTELAGGTDMCAMEEKMYEYGLELDYVEELCHDIIMGATV